MIEHLRLAEPIYWKQLKDALDAPAVSKKSGISDADLLRYGIDRANRQKTEARKTPRGDSINTAAGLDAFRRLHNEMIEYARSNDADLHAHLLGEEGVDTYQWLLEISAQAMRHILQIREMKLNLGFPRK